MGTANIILTYLICGIGFAAAFEYLIYKVNYQKEATKNWERVFWITCWPLCLVLFFWNMFKKD
tara:strand:+ start:273 stop:461 length:189 start_codon:yes stop_codon:yes gene_type:complete